MTGSSTKGCSARVRRGEIGSKHAQGFGINENILHRWKREYLEDREHIDMGIWIFALSSFLALVIALFTIAFQTIKAATAVREA